MATNQPESFLPFHPSIWLDLIGITPKAVCDIVTLKQRLYGDKTGVQEMRFSSLLGDRAIKLSVSLRRLTSRRPDSEVYLEGKDYVMFPLMPYAETFVQDNKEERLSLTSVFNRLRGQNLTLNHMGINLPNTIDPELWDNQLKRLVSGAYVVEYPHGVDGYDAKTQKWLFVIPATAGEIASTAPLTKPETRYPLFEIVGPEHWRKTPLIQLDMWTGLTQAETIRRFPESVALEGLGHIFRSVAVRTAFKGLEDWRIDLRFGTPPRHPAKAKTGLTSLLINQGRRIN